MFIAFSQVRTAVLAELYQRTYTSHENAYFSLEDLREGIPAGVGGAFLGKVVLSLERDLLIEFERGFDEVPYRFTLTQPGITQAEAVISAWQRSDDNPEGVPGSDRIVSLEHNQRIEIEQIVEAVADEIKSSNELGAALGDERERVLIELDAGRVLLKNSRVRLGALIAVLATPLRYLAEKFGGAAVGELAKQLLIALFKMMGS